MNIPDAVGTKHFIDVISCSIYSFLDKDLAPVKRLEHIWYATIFLRYWRNWLLLQPNFNLKNNFVSTNAYMCVEINAHSLLMFLLLLRDEFPDNNCYLPWMMGSQSCEKIFRALRSMSGTFSTMINFSMLGLLQRLHKLDILEELQSVTEKEHHKIAFPRQEKYGKNKQGTKTFCRFVLDDITNQNIVDTLKTSLKRAQTSMVELGMAEDLRGAKKWEYIDVGNDPQKADLVYDEEDNDDEDSEDDEAKVEAEQKIENNGTEIDELTEDLKNLKRI